MSAPVSSAPEKALLEVEGLTKYFPVTRGVFGRVVGQVRAVDGVSFKVAPGETLGLVGESGSGKTTVGRAILRLIEPTSGRVVFDGKDVLSQSAAELRKLRRSMQIVFQDPYGSLNPRMRVIDIVGEAIESHGLLRGPAVERRVAELLQRVGLSPAWINRYPHEFSGGQRQRIGVARAIALEPKLMICDEPVSALDVSIQAQVVNLLADLGRDLGLSYLFIAHDLSVVRHISHRVAVMYLGEIAEIADAKRLFVAPGHPYTRALLSAIPVADPRRQRRRLVLAGDIPTPLDPPSGCRFHTRCPAVFERCPTENPKPVRVERGHEVRCFHAYDLTGEDDWHVELSARIEQRIKDNAEERTRPTLWVDAALPTAIPAPTPAVYEPVPVRRRRAGTRTDEPRRERLLPWQRACLGAGFSLLFLLFLLAVRRAGQEEDAARELRELSAALEARHAAVGSYPSSLSELGWRLPPIFLGGPRLDPWGRPWVYEPPGKERPRFGLRSLGADAVPSRDDVALP